MLINWTLRLPWVFQYISSEFYNIVDKTFLLPLLMKEGYVWFRDQSLLLYGISGSRLRPILDRSGGSAGAEGGCYFWFTIASEPASAQKDTSKVGLFDRGVLLIPYKSILRSMCPSEKALEVRASVERSESYALGKRFALAKLTASLSPRAKLRPRLLVTSGRLFGHPRSKSAPAKISYSSRPGRFGSKVIVAYLTAFLLVGR